MQVLQIIVYNQCLSSFLQKRSQTVCSPEDHFCFARVSQVAASPCFVLCVLKADRSVFTAMGTTVYAKYDGSY